MYVGSSSRPCRSSVTFAGSNWPRHSRHALPGIATCAPHSAPRMDPSGLTRTCTPPSTTGMWCANATMFSTCLGQGRSTQLNSTSQSSAALRPLSRVTDFLFSLTSASSAVACLRNCSPATSVLNRPMSSTLAWRSRSRLCSSTVSKSIRPDGLNTHSGQALRNDRAHASDPNHAAMQPSERVLLLLAPSRVGPLQHFLELRRRS